MNTLKKILKFLDNFWHIILILQLIIIIHMVITNAPKINILNEEVFIIFVFLMLNNSKNQKLEDRLKKLEESNKPYEDGEI